MIFLYIYLFVGHTVAVFGVTVSLLFAPSKNPYAIYLMDLLIWPATLYQVWKAKQTYIARKPE